MTIGLFDDQPTPIAPINLDRLLSDRIIRRSTIWRRISDRPFDDRIIWRSGWVDRVRQSIDRLTIDQKLNGN